MNYIKFVFLFSLVPFTQSYWIRNRGAELCLISGNSPFDPVIAAKCDAPFNQKWGIATSDAGKHWFENDKFGLCLVFESREQTFFLRQACDNSSVFVDLGHGVLQHELSGCCLSINNNGHLNLEDCATIDGNFQWNALGGIPEFQHSGDFVMPEEFHKAGKPFYMRSAATKKCLDARKGLVTTSDCRNRMTQKLKSTTVLVGNELWDIVFFTEIRKCLSALNTDSDALFATDCSDENENQFWRMLGGAVIFNEDGRPIHYYTLTGKHNGLCLTDTGEELIVASCREGDVNQHWSQEVNPK